MSAPWKTALVTGASSGLGRALSAWLVQRGVKVWAAARRLEQLEALRAEAGDLIVPFQLDVSDGDATFEKVRELDTQSGGLELVIANAGLGGETRARRFDWPTLKQMIDVNVTGAVATLTGALPGMVERKRGHLVGISSLAGLVPLPKSPGYCASKAYLGMFLNSLRLEVEPMGLDVSSIHPGFVKTPLTDKNKPGSMPFLMELDDATERMGKALLRKAKVYSFPWQLTSVIGASNALPRAAQAQLLKRIR